MKKLWIIVAVLSCIALSLWLRILPIYQYVFTGQWIKFTSIDAYWQMSNVDKFAADFPTYASQVLNLPFFQWLLSAVIWCVGLGHPDQQTIDTVAAYFPAVLATLTVIPVYFIGKIMFGRMAGLIAALLVAMLPGEWLGRSVLGFTDHHVMESLLTATVILFMVVAIKRKNSLYAIPGGFFLGLYLLTWIGGIFFVLIIFAFSVLMVIVSHIKREDSLYIGYINMAFIGIAFLLFLASGASYYLMAMAVMALLPLLMALLSRYMRRFRMYYYPVALVILVAVIVLPVYYLLPDLSRALMDRLITFVPAGAREMTTLEFQPLFSIGGVFTLNIAWVNYGFLLLIIPIAITALIYKAIKIGKGDIVLLVLWSLTTIALAVMYRRFGYYLAINAALITGWFIWRIKDRFAVKDKFYGVIASIVLMALVVIPNGRVAYLTASSAPFTPPDAWCNALEWLKANSPEDSKVLAWWDYGYWIEREADRHAYATPTQQPDALKKTADILLSKTNDRIEADYIILDYSSVIDKMWAIATWSGVNPGNYGNLCYVAKDGVLSPVQLYYPDYYYSLAVRLYNFDGQAVIPHQSIVVWINDKVITSLDVFATYQEAMALADKENLQLTGTSPFISPVPFEKVEGYSLVYSSDEEINGIPQVKIFKVVKR